MYKNTLFLYTLFVSCIKNKENYTRFYFMHKKSLFFVHVIFYVQKSAVFCARYYSFKNPYSYTFGFILSAKMASLFLNSVISLV